MYKFLLLLSISDFSLFLCKNCKALLFPSNSLSSKNGDPEKTTPSLFENLIGRSPPPPPHPPSRKDGHYETGNNVVGSVVKWTARKHGQNQVFIYCSHINVGTMRGRSSDVLEKNV